MEQHGLDYGMLLYLIIPLIVNLILFFKSKSRLSKAQILFAEGICISAYGISYYAKFSSINDLRILVFGMVISVCLLLIGWIEIKKEMAE